LTTKLDIIEIFGYEENPKDIARELEIKVSTVKSKKNRDETKITEADNSGSIINDKITGRLRTVVLNFFRHLSNF
jgi:DNA-binding NarL/FixJ family response regulator